MDNFVVVKFIVMLRLIKCIICYFYTVYYWFNIIIINLMKKIILTIFKKYIKLSTLNIVVPKW